MKLQQMEEGSIRILPRGYFGMSGAGHSCPRYLWYTFRWCYMDTITDVKQRIFDRGFLEEPRIVRDLKLRGYKVDAKNFTLRGVNGHILGHYDGTVQGHDLKEKHILEVKTMKQERFRQLVKHGIKENNYTYYTQAQLYMKFSGLKKAVFIVTNKNTEDRYYEIVEYDEDVANFLVDRAEDIINTDVPPMKIGKSDWHECKWCSAYDTCHFNKEPVLTCRTCIHAIPKEDGKWACNRHFMELDPVKQREMCGDYCVLESLSTTSD